jgi:hypothetical protein
MARETFTDIGSLFIRAISMNDRPGLCGPDGIECHASDFFQFFDGDR